MLLHDCPMPNIDHDAPRLYEYQTYTTSNDASFTENHLDQSPHLMQMTLYFAICYFFCPDLVFKTIPVVRLTVSLSKDSQYPLSW
jgi:hypothetical protein